MFKHVILFVVVYIFDASGGNRNGQKKTVVIQKIAQCKEYQDMPWSFYATIRRFNRTHQGISANSTMTTPLDDSLIYDLEARVWGTSGWMHNAVKFRKNKACSTFMFLFGEVAKEVLKSAKIPQKCPVDKGFYQAKDYFIDAANIPFLYRDGRFNIITKLIDSHSKVITCLDIIISIEDVN